MHGRTTGAKIGYSGTAEMGPASEETTWIPAGTTGSIDTVALDASGTINFTGDIVGHPIVGSDSGPETGEDFHTWLHTWSWMIPFPPPLVESTFTYTISLAIEVSMLLALGPAILLAPVSIGQTADFESQELTPVGPMENHQSQQLATSSVAFPPLYFDMSPQAFFQGVTLTRGGVQRSFVVGAGHRPALKLVVGIVAVLATRSEIIFEDPETFDLSFIVAGSGPGAGLASFSYESLA
jgi:hypothetical protein